MIGEIVEALVSEPKILIALVVAVPVGFAVGSYFGFMAGFVGFGASFGAVLMLLIARTFWRRR
jgi:hypothetical protein